MKKNFTFIILSKFLLFAFFILFFSVSSAQITREQADTIVLEHIQNEVISPYFLYVNVNLPSEDGIALTTHNEESMKIKYACWAYYLNEHPEMSEPARHRYLFVKENDGNLLEVITYNDLVPADLTQWELVPLKVIDLEKSDIRIYPNPTTGELTITNYELRITGVEVFDVYGRKLSSHHLITSSPHHLINISHLQSGIYFIKITTETGIITKKVIKN